MLAKGEMMSDVVVARGICQNPACRIEMTRRPTESPKEFTARMYCSRSCATTVQMAKAKPRESRRKQETVEHLVREVEFLIGTDSSEGLAKRLGMKYSSLHRILQDEGRGDLANKLARFSLDQPEPCPVCLRMVKPSNLEGHSVSGACKSDPWGRR